MPDSRPHPGTSRHRVHSVSDDARAAILRRMTEADVSHVVAIQEPASILGLGSVFPQEEFPFPRQDVVRRWREEIGTSGIACFTVVDDDAVVGFAALRGDEILHFGVAIEHWGTGIAQRAHDALVGVLRGRGISRASLWVFTGNRRGRAFYERLGWRPTGQRTVSDFPPHPELLQYVLDLEDR